MSISFPVLIGHYFLSHGAIVADHIIGRFSRLLQKKYLIFFFSKKKKQQQQQRDFTYGLYSSMFISFTMASFGSFLLVQMRFTHKCCTWLNWRKWMIPPFCFHYWEKSLSNATFSALVSQLPEAMHLQKTMVQGQKPSKQLDKIKSSLMWVFSLRLELTWTYQQTWPKTTLLLL